MDEASYAVGSIVWVRLTGGKWWPGEVVAQETCPEEVTKGLRKEPLAIVKFFDEDFYETVKSSSHIHPFVCAKKDEFIKKGRELLKFDPNAEKFDKDVEEAMQLCGVTNEIQSDCSNSFDNTSVSNHYEPLPSKTVLNYGSAMVASSPSPCKPLASRIQAYGDYKTIEFDSVTDVRIRAQPSPASAAKGAAYACDMCSFQTNRIANIIVHHKSHSEQLRLLTYKIGSVKDRGAFSDDRISRGKDSKLTLQKVKRKIFTDSDQESKVKRKPKKGDGGTEGSSNSGTDRMSPSKKRSHQTNVPDGTPVPKRKRKKEADPDSIFDKIKKQSAKKMSRKRGAGGFFHMGALSSPHNLKGLSKRKDGSDGSSDEAELFISRGVYDNEEVADEELSTLRNEDMLDSEQLPVDENAELEKKDVTVDIVDSQIESLAEPMEISEALLPSAVEYSALTVEEHLSPTRASEFVMPVNSVTAELPLCENEPLPVDYYGATKEREELQVSETLEETFETMGQPDSKEENTKQPVDVEESAKQPTDKDEASIEEKMMRQDDDDLFFLDREPDKETDIFESDETKNESDAYLDRNASESQEEIFVDDEPAEKEKESAPSEEMANDKVEEAMFEEDLVVISDKEDLKLSTEKEMAKKEDEYFTVDDVDDEVEQAVPAIETLAEKEDALIIDEASLESEGEVIEESRIQEKNEEIVKQQFSENVKDSVVEREDEDRLTEEDVNIINDGTFLEKDEDVVEKPFEKENEISVVETSVEKEPEVIPEESLIDVEEMTIEERFSGPCNDDAESSRLSQIDSVNNEIHVSKSGSPPDKDDVEVLVEEEANKEDDIQVDSSPESAQDIFADNEIIIQDKIANAENVANNATEHEDDTSPVARVPEKDLISEWGIKGSEVVMDEQEERPVIATEELVVEENMMDTEEAICDKDVVDKVMEEIVGEVTAEQINAPPDEIVGDVTAEQMKASDEIAGEVTSQQIKAPDEILEEPAAHIATLKVKAEVEIDKMPKSAVIEVEMDVMPKSAETNVEVISTSSEYGICSKRNAEPKLMSLTTESYSRVVDLTTLNHEAIVLSGGVVTDSSIIANIPIPPDPSTDINLLASIPIPPDPTTDSNFIASIPIPPDPAPVCVMPPQLTCHLAPIAEEEHHILEYTKLQALMQPQEMEPVYLEPVMDVPIVEGEEIIHIDNEQVIDTSMDVFCNEVVIESDDKEVQEEYDNICLVTDEDRVLMASSEATVMQKVDDDKVAKFSTVQERPSSGEIMMSTTDAINGTLSQTIIGGSVRAQSMREKSHSTEVGQAR